MAFTVPSLQDSLPILPDIPEPVAPARPPAITGTMTVGGSTVPTVITSTGIYDANTGTLIMPSSTASTPDTSSTDTPTWKRIWQSPDLTSLGNNIAQPYQTWWENMIFSSRIIFAIIGLLLVAAGVFSFKSTQTVIQTGGKIAKAVAS